MTAPNLNIAILGGGPSGLLLARMLHLNSIPFTVFEAETSRHTRSQGGTLDLHTDTGLAAIKAAQLWPEFTRHVRYDGEALKIGDDQFKILFEKDGAADEASSGGRPEIDRASLREILIDSIPADKIRWGKRLREVAVVPSPKASTDLNDQRQENLELHFTDGTTYSNFDLIVGADGAFSKVRTLLTPQKPIYSGTGAVTLRLSDAATRAPDLCKLVNRGSINSMSYGRVLVAQQCGDGSLYLNFWARLPEDWTTTPAAIAAATGVKARTAFLDTLYGSWSETLREFYRQADPDVTEMRSMYALPADHRWAHHRGATLIGDAAHLTTPSGEGVNIALIDAMRLGEAIVAAAAKDKKEGGGDALDEAVKEFEEEMYIRSRKGSEKAEVILKFFLSERHISEWFGEFIEMMKGGDQAGEEGGDGEDGKEKIKKTLELDEALEKGVAEVKNIAQDS